MQPTRFGNALAATAEYPLLKYAMEGALWWPRLQPLVPDAFAQALSGAQAPMVALLNLSTVFTILAFGGAIVFVVVGKWLAAGITLVVGLLLARLCYQIGARQARELGELICIAFDLYRHDLLRQMDQDIPENLADEQKLWKQLTDHLVERRTGQGAANEAADGVADDQPEPAKSSER